MVSHTIRSGQLDVKRMRRELINHRKSRIMDEMYQQSPKSPDRSHLAYNRQDSSESSSSSLDSFQSRAPGAHMPPARPRRSVGSSLHRMEGVKDVTSAHLEGMQSITRMLRRQYIISRKNHAFDEECS